MRVGINLLFMIPGIVGGGETYAAGLLRGLARLDRTNRFTIFLNRESKDWCQIPAADNFSTVVCPVNATKRWRRYYFEQLRLPGLLASHRIDVVHSLGSVSPLGAPCPSVVTVTDLNYRFYGYDLPLVRRMALNFFVPQAVRRASLILTISEFSRRQILEEFRLSEDRVVVSHLAADSPPEEPDEIGRVCKKYAIRPPFIVAFISRFVHKNIDRLIQAFVLARRRYGIPHQLVLVGHGQNAFDSSVPLQLLKLEKAAALTGYVAGHERYALLGHASMLVFPSLYEGFGLPVLEAMAAGIPVVCSSAASMPEVAGNAAVFFDPLSVEDIAEKIARVALDPALGQELKNRGFENLKRFSWSRTAVTTLAAYRTAVDSLPGGAQRHR